MSGLTRNRSLNRLNLQMSDSLRKRLEKLRDATEADSLAEVIRRSLATYELLHNQIEMGGRVIIRSLDGDKEVFLI